MRVKVPQPIGGKLTGRQLDTKEQSEPVDDPYGLRPQKDSPAPASGVARPSDSSDTAASGSAPTSNEATANESLAVSFDIQNVHVQITPPTIIHEELNTFPESVERLQALVTDYLRNSPHLTASQGSLELKFLNYSVYFSPDHSETKIGIDVHGKLDDRKVSTIVRYEQQVSAALARSVIKHVAPLDYQRMSSLEAYHWENKAGQNRQAKMLRSRLNFAVDSLACEIVEHFDATVDHRSAMKQQWLMTRLAGLAIVLILVVICGWMHGVDAQHSLTENLGAAVLFVGVPAIPASICFGALSMPERFYRREPAGLKLRKLARVHSIELTRWVLAGLGLLGLGCAIVGWWFIHAGSM